MHDTASSDAAPLNPSGTLTSGQYLLLRLQQGLFRLSQGLNMRRIADMVQGTTTLDTDSPIWLLGVWYGVKDGVIADQSLPEEVLSAFHADLKSRVWCTYRRDYSPFIGSTLTSDVGWGCTFRSGQMLMAEALSRSMFGRAWTKTNPLVEPDMLSLLAMLADNETSLLSLHNLCAAGREYGVVAGKWLGPWVLCKALAALVNSTRPSGLQVHVVCDPGGGAPELDVANIRLLLTQPHQQQLQQQQAQHHPSPPSSSSQPATSTPTAPSSPLQSFAADGSSELDSLPTASSNSDEIQNGYSHCATDSPAQTSSLQASFPVSISASNLQLHNQQLTTATQTGMGSWNDIGFMSSTAACIREQKQQHLTDDQQELKQGSPQQAEPSTEQAPLPSQLRHQLGPGILELSHVASRKAHQSHQHPGAVLAESDLDATAHALSLLKQPQSSSGQLQAPHGSNSSADSWHDMRSTSDESQIPGSACVGESSFLCGAGDAAPTQGQAASSGKSNGSGNVPLLLLLPLTLGVDKMNPVYHPQLAAALTFPQSVGIVGGRPGASLYFVGTQNDNLLYLDPHEAQPVAKLPEHSHTYFCDTARLLPIAAMDASLALGFFVTGLDDFADLESRLRELSTVHRAAPLVTLASHVRAPVRSASGVTTLGSPPQSTALSAGKMTYSSQGGTPAASKLRSASDQNDDWEMV